jgi:hypothetical protein
VGHIVAEIGDDIGLGFFHGEAGDALEHFELALLDLGDIGLVGVGVRDLLGKSLALFVKSVGLAVESLLLLLKAALLLLHLAAAQLFFPLIFGAAFVYFFLCLYESFSFLALGAFDSIIYDLFGLLLSVRNAAFGVFLTHDKERGSRGGADDKTDQDINKSHRQQHTSIL